MDVRSYGHYRPKGIRLEPGQEERASLQPSHYWLPVLVVPFLTLVLITRLASSLEWLNSWSGYVATAFLAGYLYGKARSQPGTVSILTGLAAAALVPVVALAWAFAVIIGSA